jgi:hypothetical protein
MKTTLFVIAVAVILAGATLAQAQAVLDQTGPIGSVGWSTPATFCQKLPNSAASKFNYVSGAVSFTGTSYGTIGLACVIPGIMNGVSESNINAFGINFLDASGQTGGCTVSAYLVNRTNGNHDGWVSGRSYGSPVWTVNAPMTGNTYPLNTNQNNYEVDIYLYRPSSAVGVCNPTAYGAFVEYVIF